MVERGRGGCDRARGRGGRTPSYRHAAGVNHAPDVPADIPALPERLVEGAGDPPDGSSTAGRTGRR
ncbi:MAG: hypothetical protein IPJ14_14505 [Kineosporiaceae bacterium]|nr:hypothetical protein [Kineosporiaceae bacterium]